MKYLFYETWKLSGESWFANSGHVNSSLHKHSWPSLFSMFLSPYDHINVVVFFSPELDWCLKSKEQTNAYTRVVKNLSPRASCDLLLLFFCFTLWLRDDSRTRNSVSNCSFLVGGSDIAKIWNFLLIFIINWILITIHSCVWFEIPTWRNYERPNNLHVTRFCSYRLKVSKLFFCFSTL
jgi:hypothetical protein